MGDGVHGGQKSSDIEMEEGLCVSEQNRKVGVNEVVSCFCLFLNFFPPYNVWLRMF